MSTPPDWTYYSDERVAGIVYPWTVPGRPAVPTLAGPGGVLLAACGALLAVTVGAKAEPGCRLYVDPARADMRHGWAPHQHEGMVWGGSLVRWRSNDLGIVELGGDLFPPVRCESGNTSEFALEIIALARRCIDWHEARAAGCVVPSTETSGLMPSTAAIIRKMAQRHGLWDTTR